MFTIFIDNIFVAILYSMDEVVPFYPFLQFGWSVAELLLLHDMCPPNSAQGFVLLVSLWTEIPFEGSACKSFVVPCHFSLIHDQLGLRPISHFFKEI